MITGFIQRLKSLKGRLKFSFFILIWLAIKLQVGRLFQLNMITYFALLIFHFLKLKNVILFSFSIHFLKFLRLNVSFYFKTSKLFHTFSSSNQHPQNNHPYITTPPLPLRTKFNPEDQYLFFMLLFYNTSEERQSI